MVGKMQVAYSEKDDVLQVNISDGPEAGSIELSQNTTAELDGKGNGSTTRRQVR